MSSSKDSAMWKGLLLNGELSSTLMLDSGSELVEQWRWLSELLSNEPELILVRKEIPHDFGSTKFLIYGYFYEGSKHFTSAIGRGPQPLGHRLVPFYGLVGTGPHTWRTESCWSTLPLRQLSVPGRGSVECVTWLPFFGFYFVQTFGEKKRSLVPKRLGMAALKCTCTIVKHF